MTLLESQPIHLEMNLLENNLIKIKDRKWQKFNGPLELRTVLVIFGYRSGVVLISGGRYSHNEPGESPSPERGYWSY